jgi:putative Mg2+ transporter-C (MgtC) family protein
MPLSHLVMVTRIGIGALLGGVIGYERDRHGRPVGLRTHMLVALASATFMVVSSQFVFYQGFNHAEGVEVDASRIAASVVSAVGFIAGGSILRTGTTIQGLTTAAGLWLVTAIGLCSGAGMFIESVFVTLTGIAALTVVRRFEDKDDKITKRLISLVLDDHPEAVISTIMEAMKSLGIGVGAIEYERNLDAQRTTALTMDVSMPVQMNVEVLMEMFERLPGVMKFRIQNR